MGRWLFNLAAVVSAVLFAAVLAAQVRSYCTADVFGYERDAPPPGIPRYWLLEWNRGVIVIDGVEGSVGLSHAALPAFPWPSDPAAPLWRFGFKYETSSGPLFEHALYLPLWLPAGLTAILPVPWLWQTLRRRRQRSGPGFAPILPAPDGSG